MEEMPAGEVSRSGAKRELERQLLTQAQALHSIKAGGLRMFTAMLAAVEKQRRQQPMPSVDDLLGRMLDAFGHHRSETERHERELRARLSALGAQPSRMRELGMGAGALARVNLGRIGGQNHGANARDAFVFEHLEIAMYQLLERLAERAGDPETAELARAGRADDEDMVAKIHRNWDNVLSLMLASKGIDPRHEQGDAPGPVE